MTTFVTCIFKLNNSNPNDDRKSLENRVKYFEELLQYGINIGVVCCPFYEPYIRDLTGKYDNLKIIDVISLSDTIVYKICKDYEEKNGWLDLPHVRSNEKDNSEYMILMNSKIEFIKKAIDLNVWNTNYFCWIDFSIKYMIKNEELFKENILKINEYEMPLNNNINIIIPGYEQKKEMVYWHPIWRYSGSIFYGYKDDLVKFYDINCNYFKQFINIHKLLTWEVTIWAWYEAINVFIPIWKYGNHDDSILSFINS
jgi:hypothetical protein